MKLLIHPIYTMIAIVGTGLFWGMYYNLGCGVWTLYIGTYIPILCLTKMHALGEARRNILKKQKVKRVIYRSLILIAISVIFHISFDMHLGRYLVSLGVLALNMGFLFGIFFDPWQNEARDLPRWHFGTESDYDDWAKDNPTFNFWFEVIGFVLTLVASIWIVSGFKVF